jgi:hypothetical protein
MKLRAVWRQFEIEVAALALVVLADLPLHMRKLFLIALGFRIDLFRAFCAQMKAQKPALVVNPGCKISKSGLDWRPVPLSVFHAASL